MHEPRRQALQPSGANTTRAIQIVGGYATPFYRTFYEPNMKASVFGPVPSRRLGRSLGIDLVPLKTCTYDCIYCQLGRTTCKTVERKVWSDIEDISVAIEKRLAARPDYVTIAGSGESVLHSQIGEVIDRIKSVTKVPVAVLTNGAMLWQEEVRRQLSNADLVSPSLDAGDETVFRLVNRPHPSISYAKMLDGLVAFRQEFRGRFWLEIMVVDGYTATPTEIAKLAECAERIRPDRIQLNTVTRPSAESWAGMVSRAELTNFASHFRPRAKVIADFRRVRRQVEFACDRREVLALLERRPCSVEDIAHGLGIHRNEAIKHLEQLRRRGVVEHTVSENQCYWRAVHCPER